MNEFRVGDIVTINPEKVESHQLYAWKDKIDVPLVIVQIDERANRLPLQQPNNRMVKIRRLDHKKLFTSNGKSVQSTTAINTFFLLPSWTHKLELL